MWEIEDTTISLTRGDSFDCRFQMYVKENSNDDKGIAYELQPGDLVRFAIKRNCNDLEPAVIKILDGYDLHLKPQDTICLDFGNYYYDVHITFADGKKVTYIKEARFKVCKEAHRKWRL